MQSYVPCILILKFGNATRHARNEKRQQAAGLGKFRAKKIASGSECHGTMVTAGNHGTIPPKARTTSSPTAALQSYLH